MLEDIHVQSLDPDERDWEYDGDGTRIYKLKAGYIGKTRYRDEYEQWKARFGHDWEEPSAEETKKWYGVKNPYYVGLP